MLASTVSRESIPGYLLSLKIGRGRHFDLPWLEIYNKEGLNKTFYVGIKWKTTS